MAINSLTLFVSIIRLLMKTKTILSSGDDSHGESCNDQHADNVNHAFPQGGVPRINRRTCSYRGTLFGRSQEVLV